MTKFNSLPPLFIESTSILSETELQLRQRMTEFVLDQAEQDGLQIPQHARRLLEMYQLGELNIDTQWAAHLRET